MLCLFSLQPHIFWHDALPLKEHDFSPLLYNWVLLGKGMGGYPSPVGMVHPNWHLSLTSLQKFSTSSKNNVIIPTSSIISGYLQSFIISTFLLSVKNCECMPLVLILSKTHAHLIRLKYWKLKMSFEKKTVLPMSKCITINHVPNVSNLWSHPCYKKKCMRYCAHHAAPYTTYLILKTHTYPLSYLMTCYKLKMLWTSNKMDTQGSGPSVCS